MKAKKGTSFEVPFFRRDRPPGRSVNPIDMQQQMDVIGHNHILFQLYVPVEICHFLQVLPGNFTVCCKSDLRTVEDAGPYNVT